MAQDGGWIDTNIFIHALTHDDRSAECAAFLKKLKAGEVRGRIDPVVVHELTYALQQLGYTPARRAAYIQGILALDSVEAVGGKEELILALSLWAGNRIGFADALLSVRARADGTWVWTENVQDIEKTEAEARRPE